MKDEQERLARAKKDFLPIYAVHVAASADLGEVVARAIYGDCVGEVACRGRSLVEVRVQLVESFGVAVCTAPRPDDDPTIVEIWT